jgi:hypothetical protein
MQVPIILIIHSPMCLGVHFICIPLPLDSSLDWTTYLHTILWQDELKQHGCLNAIYLSIYKIVICIIIDIFNYNTMGYSNIYHGDYKQWLILITVYILNCDTKNLTYQIIAACIWCDVWCTNTDESICKYGSCIFHSL